MSRPYFFHGLIARLTTWSMGKWFEVLAVFHPLRAVALIRKAGPRSRSGVLDPPVPGKTAALLGVASWDQSGSKLQAGNAHDVR